jgi:tetratricopeptide (TPR) repeat protein
VSSGETPVPRLRERIAGISGRLAEPRPERREDLRAEILALFHEVEGLIEELQAVKQEVRPLVERFRELYPAAPKEARTVRVDHLGASTHRERGWSALAGGDAERARRELERALQLAPGEAATSILLAWALLELGEVDAAEAHLEAAASGDDHPMRAVVLGLLKTRRGELQGAAETLAPTVSPGTDRTARMYGYLYLGLAREELGQHREAQGCFRSALELGPNLTEAYWRLGHSHRREGRTELAVEAWRAGGENRFSPWGERCREEVQRIGPEPDPSG